MWRYAYEMKVFDEQREAVGRGPTPRAARDAALKRWNEQIEQWKDRTPKASSPQASRRPHVVVASGELRIAIFRIAGLKGNCALRQRQSNSELGWRRNQTFLPSPPLWQPA